MLSWDKRILELETKVKALATTANDSNAPSSNEPRTSNEGYRTSPRILAKNRKKAAKEASAKEELNEAIANRNALEDRLQGLPQAKWRFAHHCLVVPARPALEFLSAGEQQWISRLSNTTNAVSASLIHAEYEAQGITHQLDCLLRVRTPWMVRIVG